MWILTILFLLAIVLPITLIIVGIRFIFLSELNKKRKGILLIIIGGIILVTAYYNLHNTRILGC